MPELLVVCEGQTEREFCRSVVAPAVSSAGVWLAGTLVGKPQRKRGGISGWNLYRSELVRLAKQRGDRHVGLLVDYYAMPASWPGRASAMTMPPLARGVHVEEALQQDLARELAGRFHPCVQLHEFESLLFVEPQHTAMKLAIMSASVNPETLVREFQEIAEGCGGSVELIDDSPEHAPSKRIGRLVPTYDKVAWGVTAVMDLDVQDLRAGCAWLDRWLGRIERISG